MKANGVLETSLYVGDLDAAERFYSEVIGLEVHSRTVGRHVFFRCGAGMLLVFDPRATADVGAGVPGHGSSGPGHVAFSIDQAELDAWRGHLMQAGVAIEAEVTWPTGDRSLYFRDPAGNSIELASPRMWGLED